MTGELLEELWSRAPVSVHAPIAHSSVLGGGRGRHCGGPAAGCGDGAGQARLRGAARGLVVLLGHIGWGVAAWMLLCLGETARTGDLSFEAGQQQVTRQ